MANLKLIYSFWIGLVVMVMACTKSQKDLPKKTKSTNITTTCDTLYYHNDSLSEGRICGTKKIQFWHYYHNNGVLKSEGNYVHGKKDGFWKFWNPEGNLIEAGDFYQDKKEGYWRRYHPNQKIMEEGNYVQGNKNGWWKYYNFKGELIRDELMVNHKTK